MANMNALRPLLSDISNVQMQSDGYALWVVCPDEINSVVLQTLEDYGGIPVIEEGSQALWFFFSVDVLLASARLSVWSRFNSLIMRLHVFPASIKAGENSHKYMECDEAFWSLESAPEAAFQIWVHNSLKGMVESTPGLKLAGASEQAPGKDWFSLEVDARLPYQSHQGWYSILHPVGNPLDKEFQTGWREFFSQLEAALQRGKFRFVMHDFFLMFPLDNLRQIKSWCRDFLSLIARLKEENSEQYWPCVLAVVERRGLNINEDLPQKSDVVWEHLVPDYPHMFMRTAFMLGEEFVVHNVRFASSTKSPEDWASISLQSEEKGVSGSLPQLLSARLLLGKNAPCFYCGQTSHGPADCPSKELEPLETGIWTEVAKLDFQTMMEATGDIEVKLAESGSAEDRKKYLANAIREKDAQGVMLKAVYDIAWPFQSRSISFFWRLRNKDIGKAAKDLAPLDNHPIWEALEDLSEKEPNEFDKELQTLSVRFPQDFRIMSLRGFSAMEQGALEKAEAFWKEAEMYSAHPAIKGWHILLQARALEVGGKPTHALMLYEQASRFFFVWQEMTYRILVCRVKCGFSEAALAALVPLIDKNGHYFNRALIDPELERGYIQAQTCLFGLWSAMEQRARDEVASLKRMRDELSTWFASGNSFAEEIAVRIDKLLRFETVNNYVAFQRLVNGRQQLEKDLQDHVLREARAYKNNFRSFSERLRVIREESAWFPFPSVLVEFNKNYNKSVANMNWALQANFHNPDAFKKAQILMEKETGRLKKLENRLKFLRIIRDSTLFLLSVAEKFFWMEIVGLLLIFIVMPLVLLYGEKIGLDLSSSIIAKERWQVQKALFIVISILAAGIACMRTVFRFEYIRDKILNKARAAAAARESSGTPPKRKTKPAP